MTGSPNSAREASRRMRLEIGQAIRAIRTSRAMTQEDLATRAGVGLRTLRRMEAGGSLSLESFLRISAVLDLEESLLTAFRQSCTDGEEDIDPESAEEEPVKPTRRSWFGHSWTLDNDVID